MWLLDHKEGWVLKYWFFWIVVLEKTLWESPGRQEDQINPEYSLERLMQKLKLQCFGHLIWRTDSSKKTLMLGKFEGRRKRGEQRIRLLDGVINSMDMSLSKLWEIVQDRGALLVQGVIKSWTPLTYWTTEQRQQTQHTKISCIYTSNE